MSKDWNRASFEANTRPIHVERDITSADLVVPSNGGLLVLTLGCIACGLGLAFLFVFWPLMLVARHRSGSLDRSGRAGQRGRLRRLAPRLGAAGSPRRRGRAAR